MRRNISGIDKKHNAAGRSNGDKYINVKCSRCGSTSQLLINNVMSDILQCPVCLEGEIDYKTPHSMAVRDRRVIDCFSNLEPYILTLVQPSPN